MLNTRMHKIVITLSGKTWFPHLPISLGVALLGLLYIIPVFEQVIAMAIHLKTPNTLQQDLVGVSLTGIIQLSFSVFLLIISLGLWLRSRIAWFMAVLATIALISQALQSGISVGIVSFCYNIVLLGLLLTSMLLGKRIDVKDIMRHLLGQAGTNDSSETQISKKEK